MTLEPHIKGFTYSFSVLLTLVFCTPSFAQLKADFSVDKSGGCSPLVVSFVNRTTGASSTTSYSWDFGNGNTSTLINPGAIYNQANVYTITLTARDGSQASTKTLTVTVYNDPTVDFSASIVKGCLPLPVTFSSNSSAGSGTISNYYWDFGDGNTQQGFSSSQQHTYNVPQNVPVSLTVTNSYGCHATIQKQNVIEIIPSLTAGFTADKRILCLVSDPVQFTNNSAGPGTLSYAWDFGDGNTSTQKNPLYSFNKKGIYTVKLTVTSSEGCNTSSTQTNYLNVASYSSDFVLPSLICNGSTIYLDGASSSNPSPTNTAWEIDGQLINVGYLFQSFNTGSHTIKLLNTFGTCSQSVTKTIQVQPTPDLKGFISNIDGLCGAPEKVEFKDTTANAVQWEWNFDYTYTGPTVQSTDQAPSHQYTEARPYQVYLKVTNSEGCAANVYKSISLAGPTVNIKLVSGNVFSCGPEDATFASYGSEQITQYNWDFGDRGTSTDPQPTHHYAAVGIFQVKLNYTTINGCTGVVYFNNITIRYKPKVDFTVSATEVCENTSVYFTATPNEPDVIYWTWYFGDGTSSYASGSKNIHSYSDSGTYTIGLYVSNGCDTFITKQNLIKVLPPYPKITGYSNTCEGTRGEVTVSQNSKAFTSLEWDFGDGNTLVSIADTVKHTYTKTGNYIISLTAINGQCTVHDFMPGVRVLLKQKPVLTADKVSVCINDKLDYRVDGMDVNPAYLPYAPFQYAISPWQYNDGSNFTGLAIASNNYSNNLTGFLQNIAPGKTSIRAITQSYGFGCYDTSNYIPIQIKGASAGFVIVSDKLCYQSPVTLQDASTTTAGNPILSWLWNFGDGKTQTVNQGGTISHIYTDPGTYYVSLTITDAAGCSSFTPAVGKYVTVNGPKAAFSASGTNVALNTTVNFYNSTNAFNSYNTIYQWDFGDGASTIGFSPAHTFDKPGTFTVKLTATDPVTQCSSTAIQVIVVRDFNSAFSVTTSFITNTSCPPVLAQFTNTSVNYSSVKWDFGDGNTADNLNYVSHIYDNPGKYIVTLSVYGPNGLKGRYTDSIIVKELTANLKADGLEGCIGHLTTLSALSTNTNSYAWDFGDGSILKTTDSFATHQYMTPGTYSPVLIISDASGCTGSAGLQNKITIRPNPMVTISPGQPLICKGASIPLLATGGVVYTWAPTDGLSNNSSASTIASPGSTSVYTVNVTDDIGCKNTGSVTVTVIQPITVNLTADTAICAGSSIMLHATGAYSYNWINTTDGLSNSQIPDPIASPRADIVYTITGSDAHNCFTDTARVRIQVLPLPLIEAGPDENVMAGTPVQLHPTGSNDITQWEWSPSSYLNCSNCPAPVSTPLSQITYVLSVKNNNGCEASDTLSIKMQCDENRVSIPNVFTPNHDGKNDVFMIKGISFVKHLLIFNRWGEKVFEKNNFIAADRSSCWDGTFKGFPASEGTYVYFIELQCSGSGVFTRNGTLILVR